MEERGQEGEEDSFKEHLVFSPWNLPVGPPTQAQQNLCRAALTGRGSPPTRPFLAACSNVAAYLPPGLPGNSYCPDSHYSQTPAVLKLPHWTESPFF